MDPLEFGGSPRRAYALDEFAIASYDADSRGKLADASTARERLLEYRCELRRNDVTSVVGEADRVAAERTPRAASSGSRDRSGSSWTSIER